MLDRDGHKKLIEIERQIATADPELSALLRDGQQRLARLGCRTLRRAPVLVLALVAVLMLLLDLPASALAVTTVAASIWGLQRFGITHQEL